MTLLTRLTTITFCLLLLCLPLLIWSTSIQADTLTPLPGWVNEVTSTTVLTPSLSSSEAVSAPIYIKGLYLTYHAVGHQGLRSQAFDLIENTELNAVIIDIKGDLGLLTYKSDVFTATAIGANDAPSIRDWQTFMQYLDEHDIYAIARIVVFKDNYMARAHPEWAVKDANGELWLDREKLPWLEAFHEEVWDYNIALAVEAAQRGFDEIQFDYIRFPTDGSIGNIVYSQDIDTPGVRQDAINGFLAKADAALEPYPVQLAVDVFGYTTWHDGDFRIGQDLYDMVQYLDVLSPMLYPSTFDHGLDQMPQYDLAVAFPYEVVYESMFRAIPKVKSANPDIVVRPWIQDFPDYQFDRRIYTPDEIRAQMFASYDTGGGGWMLWDPRVKYTPEALVTSNVLHPPNENGEIMVLRYQNFAKDGEDAEGIRSPASFRRDLEQLWAAGYYPVNLRDLVVGNPNYRQDIGRLQENGLPPVQADQLLAHNLHYVPAGKHPVVLTFDGSHISQYRLLEDGSLDPNSAMGVLHRFHSEHPADWPLRATFFVQSQVDDPTYQHFGQPEYAVQKLQNLVAWGMEVGSYTSDAVDLATIPYQELRRHLKENQTFIETAIPGQVDSLAFPLDTPPRIENLIRQGFYDSLLGDYNAIATNSNRAAASPHTAAFDPHHIPRNQATPTAIETWLALYQNDPDRYYVATGVYPELRPTQ